MTKADDNYHLPVSVAILSVLVVFVGAHLLLSYVGFVPSEVSAFNSQVKKTVAQLYTVRYEREPESMAEESTSSQPTLPDPPQSVQAGEPPRKITIDAIDVSASVTTPEKTSISALDAALKEGIVHYPGSGGVDGSRPMFLFGHSSRLPTVQNDAYRAFNGLEELSVGDEITVEGASTTDAYQVMSVRVVDKDAALVDFSEDENMLILSTCTTFGARENRVVVRARK